MLITNDIHFYYVTTIKSANVDSCAITFLELTNINRHDVEFIRYNYR